MRVDTPGLFGIKHSNRDFTVKESWGKNQFNSSFPASLCNYINSLGRECVYLKIDENYASSFSELSVSELYNIDPISEDTFFAFESQYSPFQRLVVGVLPRVDLVIQNRTNGNNLSGIEIKLTALPDNTTCELDDEYYGSEIVVRPDTIVYLACSIANLFKDNPEVLLKHLGNECEAIVDWSDAGEVINYLPVITEKLVELMKLQSKEQSPLVMQPIWKTNGKSPELTDHCLDVFIWSNFAFTKLFIDSSIIKNGYEGRISRQIRTLIWLFKMLFDFSRKGQFNHAKIIDELSYNTKNDKAFAVSGTVTHHLMTCERLTKPIITKEEIKNIILGGGQNLLSPERRFDSIIFNSPDLFKK